VAANHPILDPPSPLREVVNSGLSRTFPFGAFVPVVCLLNPPVEWFSARKTEEGAFMAHDFFLRGGTILCVMIALLLATSTSLAVTVEIGASQDTMTQNDDDRGSNGAGIHFCVGRTGQPATRRALMKFNIAAASIPPGSTIDAVTLRLYETEQAGGGTASFGLHRLTNDWGEGNSNAPDGECKGTSAQLNDATWRYRFYDPDDEPGSPQWNTLGGDYISTASASTNVPSSNGNKFWSSAQMATDVQMWLDNPGTNFGWLLRRASEGGSGNALRFASRQNGSSSQRPLLTIDYTPPAVTGACCFPGQVCQELSAEDCGNGGGNFQGTGTTCTPNPCPPDPTGACCADDGTCTRATACCAPTPTARSSSSPSSTRCRSRARPSP
jgi:hypothetical protein